MQLEPKQCPAPEPLIESHPEPKNAPNAHVLFLDIVKFSTMKMVEQVHILNQLQEVVRSTQSYQEAKKSKRNQRPLIACATGDGMALVFFTPNSIPAAECAKELTQVLKSKEATFALRAGIHTGPIFHVKDINNKENVAGEGINTAQRVMDCGDAGHIIVSKVVADCLHSFPGWWTDKLEDLKQVKVKHDKEVHIFNLFDKDEGIGNPALPGKVQMERRREELEQEKERLERDTRELENRYKSVLEQIETLNLFFGTTLQGERRTKRILALATALLSLVLITAAVVIYLSGRASSTPQSPYSVEVIPIVDEADSVVRNYTLHVAESINVALNGNSDSGFKNLPSLLLPMNFGGPLNPDSGQELKSQQAVGIGPEMNTVIKVKGEKDRGNVVIKVTILDMRTNHSYPEIKYSASMSGSEQGELSNMYNNISEEVLSSYKQMPSPEEIARLKDFKPHVENAIHPYLDGLFYYKRRKKGDVEKAIQLYKDAIKLNQEDKSAPEFTLAYIGLADASISVCGTTKAPDEEIMRQIKSAIDKAVALEQCDNDQPSSGVCPQVLTSRAVIDYWLFRDWERAAGDFGKAKATSTTDAAIQSKYGMYLLTRGERSQAEVYLKLALSSPSASAKSSKAFQTILGQIYYFSKKNKEAIEQLEKLKENFPTARRFFALATEQAGDFNTAISELKKIPKESNDYYDALAALGHAYALKGANQDHPDLEAEEFWNKTLPELENKYRSNSSGQEYISPYNLAIIYAGALEAKFKMKRQITEQDKERVRYYLDEAIRNHDVRTAWFETDPRLQIIKTVLGDSEFNKWAKAARSPVQIS